MATAAGEISTSGWLSSLGVDLANEEIDIREVLSRIGMSESRSTNAIRSLLDVSEQSVDSSTFTFQHLKAFAGACQSNEFEGERKLLEYSGIVNLLLAVVGRGTGALSIFTRLDLTTKSTRSLQDVGHLSDQAAEILCANLEWRNSRLSFVCLRRQIVFGKDETCQLLANALRCNTCLKELLLPETNLDSKAVRILVSRLKDNHTLERLDIGMNSQIGDEGAGYVAQLLLVNTSLNYLQMYRTGMRRGGIIALSGALAHNTTLRYITLGRNQIGQDGMRALLQLLTPGDALTYPTSVSSSGSAAGGRHNTTLTQIELGRMRMQDFCVESMALMIERNKSLTSLELQVSPLDASDWVQQIIPALRKNSTLQKLSLWGSQGVSSNLVFDGLMELVTSSDTALEEINVDETPLAKSGKAGLLAEELRIRKEYRAKLRGESMRVPTCGRFVLCGYEFSGKTTICRTMGHIIRDKPDCHRFLKMALQNFLRTNPGIWQCLYGTQASREFEERTRGYEVMVLRDEDSRRTSIWDFAGQKEYYVLHDFMLPGSRNTYFLFVCSAVYPAYHNLAGKPKTQEDMEREFQYWLRFLASNTKPSHPPKVMFILTNKDALRTLPKMSRSKSWADAVVRNMKEKFKDSIHFEDRACVVNAQSSRDIEGLLEQVENGLKQLLTGGPQEYELCEDVRLALQKWTADNPSMPIIRMKEFQELVQAQMRRKLEGLMAADSGRNAVLAYLHDVGEIIFPAGLDFMVVNPTWFGRGVLGSLIDAFRKIQEPGEGCLPTGLVGYVKDWVSGEVWAGLYHEHGFVSYENMEELLSTSLRTMHLKEIITPKDLITLMIKLEMCFRKEPENEESALFIPAVFDDDDELAAKGMCKREWKLERSWSHGSAEHVGRRLQCRNKAITFLSPGFFPRLQVVLRNHFYSKGWAENGAFQVDRNLIAFSHDGHEVLVEYSGDIDCFVDILAKSFQPVSRTLQFVQEDVIKRIVEFCASPQGCQGVRLVEAAIRHVCVEELHLCADRVDHAVLLSVLEDQLAADPDEKASIHTWKKQIEGVDDCDYALDLLEGKGSFDKFQQAKAEEQEELETCYPDRNARHGNLRGRAILISMEKYKGRSRSGGQLDRGRWESLATTLYFETRGNIFVDCLAKSIRDELLEIAQKRIPEEDECLVCFIDGHGSTAEDGSFFVMDGDGTRISLLKDIVEPFRACKNLLGKPKIFFINACRGNLKLKSMYETGDEILEVSGGSGDEDQSRPLSSLGAEARLVLEESDCLIVFSTSPQAVSLRDTEYGTNFAYEMMHAVHKKRGSKDLATIITLMAGEVAETEVDVKDAWTGEVRKLSQCPVYYTSLRKLVYWRSELCTRNY